MKLIMKRQRGSAEAPSALEYGELALTKAGELYAGDESGAAVRVTAGAERRAENIAYDVKMLQLMRILEDAEPAMLAGFIEGFRDRSKTALAQNVTFDTANHRLKFDGKSLSGGSGAESEVTASVSGPGYTSRLAAGSHSNVVARPQGKMVQAAFQCQTPAAMLSTDVQVMDSTALRQERLILPGSSAQTPSGPGLPLNSFLSSIRTMAGKDLSARLASPFTTVRQP